MTEFNQTENINNMIKYTKNNDQAYTEKSPSLLLEAIYIGNKDTIKYLINMGVDPTFVDMNGNSFFHHIYRHFKGNDDTIIELFDLLLKKSNNIGEYYEVSDKEETLIKYSSSPSSFGRKIDRSSLYVTNCSGKTILTLIKYNKCNQLLDYILKQSDLVAIIQGNHLKFFEEFVNTFPNKLDKYGLNPLQMAVKFNNQKMVKITLDAGVTLDKPNYPLHLAIKNKNIEIVKFLLEAKVNPNKQNDKGETPLLLTVKQNNLAMTDLLLKYGADVNKVINDQNETVIFYTIGKKIANLLVSKGSVINTSNKLNETPLIKYIKEKRYDIAEILLSKGADPNYKTNNYPIFYAIAAGDPNFLQLLLDYNANVNINLTQLTPLLFAAERSTPEIVDVLLKYGVCIYAENGEHNNYNVFEYIYLSGDDNPNEKLKLLLKYSSTKILPNTIRYLRENYFENCPEFTKIYKRKWFNKWGDWVKK